MPRKAQPVRKYSGDGSISLFLRGKRLAKGLDTTGAEAFMQGWNERGAELDAARRGADLPPPEGFEAISPAEAERTGFLPAYMFDGAILIYRHTASGYWFDFDGKFYRLIFLTYENRFATAAEAAADLERVSEGFTEL